ncbi:unnamed protein product [Parnassius apollo]|uniref:(apollo) hypothetical protein n=1 Tax=Parnassius apollo TaxID=110799 RepID=A0A8S3WUX8_PARAO|nr:unnamed protein product [Parnassius apollo]
MIPQKLLQTILKSLIWINCFIYFGTSLQIRKINNPSDVQIARKLTKFLDGKRKQVIRFTHQNREQKDTIEENIVKNKANTIEDSYNLNDDKEKHQTLNYFNRILVKRIVPHGLETPNFVYDFKHKTYYKPLTRIHKNNKALDVYKKSNKHSVGNNYLHFITSKNKRNKLNNYQPNSLEYYNEYFLQPFKYKSGKLYLKSSIEEIEELTKLVKRLLKVLNLNKIVIKKPQPVDNDETLTRKFEKSGEAHDPLAPGKKFETSETTTERQKVWLPYYPPWTYWNYKKSVYQDECPGLLIANGRMCINTPPH